MQALQGLVRVSISESAGRVFPDAVIVGVVAVPRKASKIRGLCPPNPPPRAERPLEPDNYSHHLMK